MVLSFTRKGNIEENFIWEKGKMNLILKNVDYEGLGFIREDAGNTGRAQRSKQDIDIC